MNPLFSYKGDPESSSSPEKFTHLHVGVGESLRDGFLLLVHFPDENSEGLRGEVTCL